jgi:hypothetical protein
MAGINLEFTQIQWACSAQSKELLPKNLNRKGLSGQALKAKVNREFDEHRN